MPILTRAIRLGITEGSSRTVGSWWCCRSRRVYYGSNTILVAEDQVTYGTGGRWGQWAGGGGSSLELIDPHSNHRLAANWADSDDTAKSQWVDIENTGVLDNGANRESALTMRKLACWMQENAWWTTSRLITAGVNYVANGTFETGLADWSLQGCMSRSSLENTGYAGSYSLHIRCSDKVWTGDNSCQVSLNGNSMGPAIR